MNREVVVFEREPWWAPELRRQFANEEIPVRHCVDVASVGDVLARNGEAVVVAHLPSRERDCADLLRELPAAMVMVVADAETVELEAPLREAGANSFALAPMSGEELCMRIRRFWAGIAD